MKALKFGLIWILFSSPFLSFAQCEEIVTTTDKFTDVVSKSSPMLFEKQGKKSGTNIIERKNTVFAPVVITHNSDSTGNSLIVSVKGGDSGMKPRGAYFILANGEKLQFPDAYVSPQLVGKDIIYIASIQISRDHIDLFTKSAIRDIRVFTSECTLEPWLGEKLRSYFECFK